MRMTPVVPARPLLVAIVLAALAGGGIVVAVELASATSRRAVWASFAPAVGWSFIGTGLYAWRRRPESRIGALMILLGFAWFVYTLQAANSRLVSPARWSSAACGARSSCTWA